MSHTIMNPMPVSLFWNLGCKWKLNLKHKLLVKFLVISSNHRNMLMMFMSRREKLLADEGKKNKL